MLRRQGPRASEVKLNGSLTVAALVPVRAEVTPAATERCRILSDTTAQQRQIRVQNLSRVVTQQWQGRLPKPRYRKTDPRKLEN